jgi:hypothetical protein
MNPTFLRKDIGHGTTATPRGRVGVRASAASRGVQAEVGGLDLGEPGSIVNGDYTSTESPTELPIDGVMHCRIPEPFSGVRKVKRKSAK